VLQVKDKLRSIPDSNLLINVFQVSYDSEQAQEELVGYLLIRAGDTLERCCTINPITMSIPISFP
jgi:hypothetical protein